MKVYFYNFIYFIFGCARSSLLHRLFFSCGARGLLVVVAFLVVEHRLQCMWASVVEAHGLHRHAPLGHRLDSFGLWA